MKGNTMQKVLRFFAQNATKFAGFSALAALLGAMIVPFGHAAFAPIVVPFLFVGLAAATIIFLEDLARNLGEI